MDIVYWRNNLDINLIVLPSLGGEQKDSKLSLGPMPFCRISESFVFVLLSKRYPGPGSPEAGRQVAWHWPLILRIVAIGQVSQIGVDTPGRVAVGSLNKDRPSVNLEMSNKFQDNVWSVVW